MQIEELSINLFMRSASYTEMALAKALHKIPYLASSKEKKKQCP